MLLGATVQLTPMQLATLYATIAAGGVYQPPHLITRVELPNGDVLQQEDKVGRRGGGQRGERRGRGRGRGEEEREK